MSKSVTVEAEGTVATAPREVLGAKFAPEGLTIEEQAIFWKLMMTKESANLIVPEGMDGAELWKHLKVTMKGVKKAQEALARLKPLLGRILLLVKEKPHLWQNHGYSNFSDFITNGVPTHFGISRPEAYNCMKVAIELGFLPLTETQDIGFAKANVVATALRHATSPDMAVEMVEAKRALWVQRAGECTVLQLKEHMANDLLIEHGSVDKVSVIITTTQIGKDAWEKFKANQAVRDYCGSEDEGEIFMKMREECETEWDAQSHDENRINQYHRVPEEVLST